MAYSIEFIKPKNLMHICYFGPVNLSNVLGMMGEASSADEFKSCKTHLGDIRQAESYDLTSDCLNVIGRHFAKDYIGKAPAGVHVAIVLEALKPIGMVRKFISQSPTMGTTFAVFSDPGQGAKWLDGEPAVNAWDETITRQSQGISNH